MKYKLMSLAVVLGLAGCKADTGTVMYVVNSPLPDDDCVYQETSKVVRYSGFFDPTQATHMEAFFTVHNSLNAKDTDLRADNNGVNVRPDGNHIQIEKVRVCYYKGDDVEAAQVHDCDETVPECQLRVDGATETVVPCRKTVPSFSILPAEESSSVDEGGLVSVDLLHRDVLSELFSGSDSLGNFVTFDPDTIRTSRELTTFGAAPIDTFNQFAECRAPGVANDSPTDDEKCVGATATELQDLGVSSNFAGQIVSGFGPRAYEDDEKWGPVNSTFGSVGQGVTGSKILTKMLFMGQTVSGAEVVSSPFIFPIDVCPGCTIQTSVVRGGGSCGVSRVMCAEQTRCQYRSPAGQTMTGVCTAGGAQNDTKYRDGCLLGNGFEFTGNDSVLTSCIFGLSGTEPQVSGCEPDQLLGKADEYTCVSVNTCEDAAVVDIPDACGDGIVSGTEACDEGPDNGDGSSGCAVDCTNG